MNHLFQFQNMASTLRIVGCHFGIQPERWTFGMHHHHLYELICCMEGIADLDINGSAIRLEAGDWLLLKPGVAHAITNVGHGHYVFFNVHFDLDDLNVRGRLGQSAYRRIPSSAARESGLPESIRKLEQFLHRDLAGDAAMETSFSRYIALELHEQLAVQAYILLLIQDILRMTAASESSGGDGTRPATAYEQDVAHAIADKLMFDLSDNPRIETIARELHLSRSQASKIFSGIYGLSPRQYVSRVKQSKAKELLASTNLTVYAIAEQLGFGTVNHFSRQFRRWTGMSPNQYRHSAPAN
ncbi:AraC family transcriptional regulator [Paenibacillus sp. LHD-117]|uniref:AraC family transcriptional regulator n=1 Tax=Paenibacillus sp. LHD-117 TaxID=3071412 RepID=UPI0027DF36E9|nr:AraC family transcriptional regulator [Paenibacillus sp. LHD-117]MDQ6421533.1 AraC family transcriptional regulator [Paenibacillus sp. LHD-117]